MLLFTTCRIVQYCYLSYSITVLLAVHTIYSKYLSNRYQYVEFNGHKFNTLPSVYRPGYFTVHPPPPRLQVDQKFSNSENCCGSENAMPPTFFWDMDCVYVLINISLSTRIFHRALPPPPAPSGPKFSNSENCCDATKNVLGYGGSQRQLQVKKRVFFQKAYFVKKNHNKSHYFFYF